MSGLKTFVRIFRQTGANDVIQRRGRYGLSRCDGRRLLVKNCRNHRELRLAIKRPTPGRHFV